MLRKGWWVEHDEVVFLVVGIKKLERIFTKRFVTRVVSEVLCYVAVR